MAFEVIEREGYVELRLHGVMDGSLAPAPELLQRLSEMGRLLVNAAEVEWVTADVMWMVSVVNKALAAGSFRSAVVAENDVVFGTLRQVAAYRDDTPAAQGVEFFRERDEAVRWLLLPG